MLRSLLLALSIGLTGLTTAQAEPAISVLGRDYIFPHAIAGMPAKLSDFPALQIKHFTTSDGVRMTWWEAGTGRPIVIIPGWSSNGAEYVNVMWLLARNHRVLVLDPRNQGLSGRVDYGARIARYAADLHEFRAAAQVGEADYVGHSMGASVIWSHIDLYGTKGMRKLVFIDEGISLIAGSDWTDEQRRDAGAIADSYDGFRSALAPKPDGSDLFSRLMRDRTPYFENSQGFSDAFIHNDMAHLGLVMRDHAGNDWRDVISHKIDRPTAFFTGELSANVASQHWAARQIPDARVFVYTAAEHGDHLLAYKNPVKFVADLTRFLDQ